MSTIPEQLLPLSWLIGAWAGVGVAGYPTIEEINFGQEVLITCDGRPFLTYQSRTWAIDADGTVTHPLAAESGFFRPAGSPGDNRVELLLAHPTGYAEVWIGSIAVTGLENATITGARMELGTDVIARTETAKEVTAGTRLYGLVDGELLWAFDMAAVGQPMASHVSARLRPMDTGSPRRSVEIVDEPDDGVVHEHDAG